MQLPAYTKETKNEVFGRVVSFLETFRESQPKKVSLFDQTVADALFEAKFSDGFGTGLLIVSSDQLDAGLRERFNKCFSFDMNIERGIESKLSSTPIGDVVGIQNLGKSGGIHLAGWGDSQSRQELTTILLRQIDTNIIEIAEIKRKKKPPVDSLIDMAHYAFMSNFMIGLLRGIAYAKPDYFANMVYLDQDDAKHEPIKYLAECADQLKKLEPWKVFTFKSVSKPVAVQKTKEDQYMQGIRERNGIESLAARYLFAATAGAR